VRFVMSGFSWKKTGSTSHPGTLFCDFQNPWSADFAIQFEIWRVQITRLLEFEVFVLALYLHLSLSMFVVFSLGMGALLWKWL